MLNFNLNDLDTEWSNKCIGLTMMGFLYYLFLFPFVPYVTQYKYYNLERQGWFLIVN